MPTIVVEAADVREREATSVRLGAAVICGVVRHRMTCRRYLRCWNCDRVRLIAQTWSGSLWYGDHFRCSYCGDGWADGYQDSRPFERAWRTKAIARAKRDLADAVTRDYFRAIVHAHMESELGADA